MLLGIELTVAEKIVDLPSAQRKAYIPNRADHFVIHLKELAFHLVLPPSILQLLRDGEDHIDRTGNHALGIARLLLSCAEVPRKI